MLGIHPLMQLEPHKTYHVGPFFASLPYMYRWTYLCQNRQQNYNMYLYLCIHNIHNAVSQTPIITLLLQSLKNLHQFYYFSCQDISTTAIFPAKRLRWRNQLLQFRPESGRSQFDLPYLPKGKGQVPQFAQFMDSPATKKDNEQPNKDVGSPGNIGATSGVYWLNSMGADRHSWKEEPTNSTYQIISAALRCCM